ncbi:MAG: hypothetical protein CVT92_02685 [Bacteroidetes bacterium HGW-Bacteroidetes-1]|jgi:rubredoxin|nr:MAG: hypothetical protein CVT92_02685 [Bacteroidetes bacterium HGW-Bacteroidetes-1]
MKLISCNRCGVVFNQDAINFPDITDHDTQEINVNHAFWDGDKYVPKIKCPVCGADLVKEE